MRRFSSQVYEVVKTIPIGKVMSYGQVALYIGLPRAAQQVGWTLNRMKAVEEIPWWRVVNNQGRVSIKNFRHSAIEQRNLLRKEGIKITEDFDFDIEKYRFIPDSKLLEKFKLDPMYLLTISSRILYANYFPKRGLANRA